VLPDGTGWILDGFPVTVAQAVLLEKAVSGHDAAAAMSSEDTSSLEPVDSQKPMKKSKLLTDPRPAPPTPPPISGLDAVILLDISDELCLLRATDTPRRYLFFLIGSVVLVLSLVVL